MPRARPTLLTEDLVIKIEKLVTIGYRIDEVHDAIGIGWDTWFRWSGRRYDEKGEDLSERHGAFRRMLREARKRWVDERDRLAADILFPPEDNAREVRGGMDSETVPVPWGKVST